MMPAGLGIYEKRNPVRSGIYAFGREHAEFDAESLRVFQQHRRAFTFSRSSQGVLPSGGYVLRLEREKARVQDSEVSGAHRVLGTEGVHAAVRTPSLATIVEPARLSLPALSRALLLRQAAERQGWGPAHSTGRSHALLLLLP